MINYLQQFIPNLSEHTAPLRELEKKDVIRNIFEKIEKCLYSSKQCFMKLIESLTSLVFFAAKSISTADANSAEENSLRTKQILNQSKNCKSGVLEIRTFHFPSPIAASVGFNTLCDSPYGFGTDSVQPYVLYYMSYHRKTEVSTKKI